MGFKVKFQANLPTDEHGDAAVYEFLEGGVLKVTSADRDGQTFYIAPGVWQSVIADKTHGPGYRKA